jgi:ADP-dependent NAD(P)H-hydrate dehydratase / NAD(P)H-hydrate epimerase
MTFPKLFESLSQKPASPPWNGQESIAFEQYLQQELGLAAGLLMENAALALAQLIQHLTDGPAGSIIFLVGPGNNGGDALVALRQLHQATPHRLYLWAPLGLPRQMGSPAADASATACHLAYGPWIECPIPQDPVRLVVDGLFGVGLSRPLTGTTADVIQKAQNLQAPVLAVDCPSGLDATTGEVLGTCLAAQHTLSFAGAKQGFYQAQGPQMAGRVHIAPIGVSQEYAEHWLDVHRGTHAEHVGQA